MNILTDILSLIRRGVYAETAGSEDVLVLGVNEEPDMTGVASPIPYKSVKLIKIKDLKVAGSSCDYKNSPTVPPAGTGQVYQKTEVDATTKACTVFFRSLKSMSSNLTFATSADDNFIEITTEGEPNTAANVGSGAGVWKDKVGETLNFKSLVQGNNITVGQSSNEITLSVPAGAGLSLTTTGTSGAATLTSGVLNIPNYATGGGGGMTDFLIGGDSGSNQTVSNGDTVDIEGGDGIATVGTGGPKVVVNMSHFYQALIVKLSQGGSSAPSQTVVYNDTGKTLSWSRVSTGRYTATWSSSVDTPRVVINTMQVFKNHPNVINIIGVTATQFTLCTNELSGSGSPEADSVLEDTPLEIRIYPSTI